MVDLIGLPKSRDNQFWLLDVIVDDGLALTPITLVTFFKKKKEIFFQKKIGLGKQSFI